MAKGIYLHREVLLLPLGLRLRRREELLVHALWQLAVSVLAQSEHGLQLLVRVQLSVSLL